MTLLLIFACHKRSSCVADPLTIVYHPHPDFSDPFELNRSVWICFANLGLADLDLSMLIGLVVFGLDQAALMKYWAVLMLMGIEDALMGHHLVP